MGKPRDPDYWRKWRAAHPDYRERERQRLAARDRTGRDRSGEYVPKPPVPPLGRLYPERTRGVAISFWEDELRMDLAQEAALAELEGVDPVIRCRRYRYIEKEWRRMTTHLFEEAA